MTEPSSTRFTDSRSEFESRKPDGTTLVYTGALHLPQNLKPYCEELRELNYQVEQVNVMRPLSSYFRLRDIRAKWLRRRQTYELQLSQCIHRMGEPVEGASSIDLSWIQGFTFAAGMSAFLELQGSMAAVTESLDRKSAYSMAIFSLYVAAFSLVVSAAFGIVSLR